MTDPTTPTTEAGLQRYSLVIEQDDSAYLERDPAGHWCIADDAEDAVAQARAEERRRLAGLVEGLHGLSAHDINEGYDGYDPDYYTGFDEGV